MTQTDRRCKSLVCCGLVTAPWSLYVHFNWHIFNRMTCCYFSFFTAYTVPFPTECCPLEPAACPLSNPCIGYPLVRTGLVELTVSKVVENQKEKVQAVPESILYYTLHFIKHRKDIFVEAIFSLIYSIVTYFIT